MDRSSLIMKIEEFMKERTSINQQIALYKSRISEHLEKSGLNINIGCSQNISFSQPVQTSIETFIEGTNFELEREKREFVNKTTIHSDIEKEKMKIMMTIEKENKELTMNKRKELFEVNENCFARRKELLTEVEQLMNGFDEDDNKREIQELFNDCNQLSEQIMQVQNDTKQLLTDIDSKNRGFLNYLYGIHNEKRKLLIPDIIPQNNFSFASIFQM